LRASFTRSLRDIPRSAAGMFKGRVEAITKMLVRCRAALQGGGEAGHTLNPKLCSTYTVILDRIHCTLVRMTSTCLRRRENCFSGSVCVCVCLSMCLCFFCINRCNLRWSIGVCVREYLFVFFLYQSLQASMEYRCVCGHNTMQT
jgi:hypothetical protein